MMQEQKKGNVNEMKMGNRLDIFIGRHPENRNTYKFSDGVIFIYF